jgi:hypothetical protein
VINLEFRPGAVACPRAVSICQADELGRARPAPATGRRRPAPKWPASAGRWPAGRRAVLKKVASGWKSRPAGRLAGARLCGFLFPKITQSVACVYHYISAGRPLNSAHGRAVCSRKIATGAAPFRRGACLRSDRFALAPPPFSGARVGRRRAHCGRDENEGAATGTRVQVATADYFLAGAAGQRWQLDSFASLFQFYYASPKKWRPRRENNGGGAIGAFIGGARRAGEHGRRQGRHQSS